MAEAYRSSYKIPFLNFLFFQTIFIIASIPRKCNNRLSELFDSRPENPQYKDGALIRPPMNLIKSDDGKYVGSTTVAYDSEGDKCMLFEEIPILAAENCSLTPTNTIIHISAVDSLFQLNANRITLTLTYVLVAFTIVAIRSFVKDMIQNLSDFRTRN